jgi:hypothetical protein
MAETFEVGDAAEYEDAYTGELKHGRITHLAGGDIMIRTITEKEAGRNPKRLPKPRIVCSFAKDEGRNPICSYHRVGLNQLAVHGDQPNPPAGLLSLYGSFAMWCGGDGGP